MQQLEGPQEESETGTAEESLVYASAASCAEGLISSGTCAGPWKYSAYVSPCYVTERHSSCSGAWQYPDKTCYGCRLPQFGIENRTSFTHSTTAYGTRRTICDYDVKPPCHDEYFTESTCAGLAKSYLAARVAAADVPSVSYTVTVGARVYFDVKATSARWRESCTINFSNFPTYKFGESGSCTTNEPFTCPDTANPIYPLCTRQVEPSRCGPDASPKYSSPGLSLSGLQTQAGNTWVASQAPVCLTSDDKSSVDGSVPAKYGALMAQRDGVSSLPSGSAPTGVNQAVLRDTLVKHMKLLFELKGQHLSSEQKTDALTKLYVEWPQPLHAGCGAVWTPPATSSCPSSEAARLKKVNGTLTLCRQLLQSHVSPAVRDLARDTCFNLADDIRALPATQCARDTYQQQHLELTTALLEEIVKQVSTSLQDDTPRTNELRGKLAAIDSWYVAARKLYPAPATESSARLGAVLKLFWNAAYLQNGNNLSATNATEAEAARARIFNDGDLADRQVLRAAFLKEGSTLPMTHAPLLYVLGDALTGLGARLHEASLVHDMGCRFKNCTGTGTQTSQLMALLAALPLPTEFAARLSASTLVNAGWKNAFMAVKDGHPGLQAAILDAFGTPTAAYDPYLLFTSPVDSLPASTLGLASILKDARTRAAAYSFNGLFTPTASNELEVGLNRDRQSAVFSELMATNTRLQTSLNAYEANKTALVSDLVNQIKNQQQAANAEDRLELLQQQYLDLSADLHALRVGHAVDHARYGDFMKGLNELIPALYTAGDDFKREPTVHLHASGQSAWFSLVTNPQTGEFVKDPLTGAYQPLVTDLGALSVFESEGVPFTRTVQANDHVNIQVQKAWSPTCALGELKGPNGKKVQAAGAMTASEGFTVQTNNNEYSARGIETVNATGHYESRTDSRQECTGFSMTPWSMLGMGSVNMSLTECQKYEATDSTTRSRSESNGSGEEVRTTLSMARGVRSELTPFPDQPAGSLLLLLVPSSKTAPTLADVTSVQVVQSPFTSVLVKEPSNIYLMVNDLNDDMRCPDTAASLQELDIDVSLVTPMSEAAKNRFLPAMQAAVAQVRALGQAYVGKGRLIPHEVETLRAAANHELTVRLQSTATYPESLHNLFHMHVSTLLADVEREAEVVNIERQMRTTVMNVHALVNDLGFTAQQGRLLALLPAWKLRNLDGVSLRGSLMDLNRVMNRWLLPIITLYFPETLTNISESDDDKAKLGALTDFDPTTATIQTLATATRDAAIMVEARLSQARSRVPTPTRYEVVLSIPAPGKTPATNFRRLDAETAQVLWNDIYVSKDITLKLRPEYFMNRLAGSGQISCSFVAPVIRSMAFYLVMPPNSGPPQLYNIPVEVSREDMLFPTVSELRKYNFVSKNYLAPTVPMFIDVGSTVLKTVGDFWSQDGRQYAAGVSPFGDFYLELGSFGRAYPSPNPPALSLSNPLSKALELLVIFEVEVGAEGPNMPLAGVPTCSL